MKIKLLSLLLVPLFGLSIQNQGTKELTRNSTNQNVIESTLIPEDVEKEITESVIEVESETTEEISSGGSCVELNDGFGAFIEIEFPDIPSDHTKDDVEDETTASNELMDNIGDVMPGEGFGPLV